MATARALAAHRSGRRITHILLASCVLLPALCLIAPMSTEGSPGWSAMNGPGDLNHPVFVIPSSAVHVPSGWPLDATGAITCSTCHLQIPRDAGGSNPHLRGFSGASNSNGFCANCHNVDGSQTAANMHWLALGRAHIGGRSGDGWNNRGSLDFESRNCLGCHDGVAAGETGYDTGSGHGAGSFSDRGRNHPVGIEYPRGGKTREGIKYRLPSLLPKSVRLPGGTVGCVSCHDLYSATPKRLSVPIEGSALCFACHDMN